MDSPGVRHLEWEAVSGDLLAEAAPALLAACEEAIDAIRYAMPSGYWDSGRWTEQDEQEWGMQRQALESLREAIAIAKGELS